MYKACLASLYFGKQLCRARLRYAHVQGYFEQYEIKGKG